MKASQNASTGYLNVITQEKLVNFIYFKISWRQYNLKEDNINISNYGEKNKQEQQQKLIT